MATMYEFVISPEPFIEKCRSLARAKNPFLEVVVGRVRLAWITDDTIGFIDRADAIGLGITSPGYLRQRDFGRAQRGLFLRCSYA